MIDSPALLTLKQLSVRRGGKPILTGVSADIPRGSITALVGLNGSGKSTLLRTLLGEFPYRGDIQFRCGHNHLHRKPKHIGYVPQRLQLESRLPVTVIDLFALAFQKVRPLFLGISKSVITKAKELLARVDAAHLLEVPVDGLSGGQLQRILFALAMEPEPELLLLDEPASGIDFKDEQDFYRLISTWNSTTHGTVLLVSHDLATVRTFATHVLCLAGGKIRAAGHPDTVLSEAALQTTFGTSLLQRAG